MILLLKEPVSGLGDMGDVVEVSDGYGRNYLLPQRLAVANTPENRTSIETLKLVHIQREAERARLAEHAAKDLQRALLQVHMKAQEDGTLYGSVNQAVVCQVVQESKGFKLEERWVVMPEPIKKIGDYDVTVRLPGDMDCTFKLTVLPESD